MIVIALLIFGAVVIIDLVPLIKQKKKKESIIVSIFIIAGLIGAFLFVYRINVPKPLQIIEEFIKKSLGIGYN